MQQILSVPTVQDVERIAKIKDPVIRNLLITQCYHELSDFFTRSLGLSANWCTFATWASRQAGETIRKEDLMRLLERCIRNSPSTLQASAGVASAINLDRGNQLIQAQAAALEPVNFQSAVERASDAVGRGNKKVFEEIGFEFARFYQACFRDQHFDPQQVSAFCDRLRAGQPPDGQDYLHQAFVHYAEAAVEANPKTRAELILLANLEIGLHEQTRLQPEIAESMDSGMLSFLDFARSIFSSIFPAKGWLHLAHLYLMRLIGRPTPLDLALRSLFVEIRSILRQVVTEALMTISFPPGVVLKLGEDLSAGYPDTLKQITDPALQNFLVKHDLSQDSLSGSGALDWADLPDRLNFILDLFRCYQEYPNLFDPPFSPEQVVVLKDGRLPPGRL